MVRGGTILKVVFGLAVVLVVAVVVLVATFDLNAYKGRLAAELGRLTGREVTIAGDIGLALSLTPTIAVEGVTLGNAAWAGSEPMVAVDRLEAKIAVVPLLSGIVSIDSLELDAPRILLATNAAGQGNWALTPAAKPAAQTPPAASKSEPTPEPTPDPAAAQSTAAAPVSFDIRSVTITDALLTYKDGKAGGPPTTLTLKSLTLLSEGAGQPLDVDLQGALGARLLGLSGKLGAIDTILAGQPMAVDLAFETDGLSGTVKGSVAEPLKGKGLDLAVVARAADLSDLAGNSVAALPLDLSTRITQDGAAYRLGDLALRLGASSVSGALRIDPAAKPLAVTGVLAAPLLDLAELLPKRPALSGGGGGAGAPGTSSGRAATVIPDTPIDVSALVGLPLRADVPITIDKLVLPNGIVLDKVALRARVAPGKIGPADFSTALGGGVLAGVVSLDAAGAAPSLALSLKGERIVLGALARDLGKSDLVEEAPLRLSVDLAGSGASPHAIAQRLNGTILLDVGPGRINNALVDLIGGDVLSQVNGLINPFAAKQSTTGLRCAVFNVPVKAGVLTWDRHLALETDRMTVASTGSVALGPETLDVGVRPRPRDGVGLETGLGRITQLFRVSGTFAKPYVDVDVAQALTQAVGTAASLGAAAATMGGSVALGQIAGSLLGVEEDDPAPCLTALGQKAPPKAASQATPGTPAEALRGVLDSVIGKGESGEGTTQPAETLKNTLDGLFKRQ